MSVGLIGLLDDVAAIAKVKSAAEAVAHAFPPLAAILEWAVEAAISGVLGLLVGAVSIPVAGFVFAPAWKSLKRFLPRRQNTSAP